MTTTLLIVLLVLSAVMVFAIFMLARQLQDLKNAQTKDQNFVLLNQNVLGMSERIDKTTLALGEKLDVATRDLNNRLTDAARVVGDVKKELGTVQERFKGFEEFNELLHPKMRGNIGEQILSDMLAQVFPQEQYELQKKFKDGNTVDALLKTKSGSVPVDSKFPLENFKQLTRAADEAGRKAAAHEFAKAVKKHIDDISRKYILPEEGTVNFAVMYVPSENVYYHILTDDDEGLTDYAKSKNVVMVSPHAFYAFLRVILMGLEREKLHAQSQKIWEILKGVEQEAGRFNEHLSVLGRHITNSKNAMDTVSAAYTKLTGKIEQVKQIE